MSKKRTLEEANMLSEKPVRNKRLKVGESECLQIKNVNDCMEFVNDHLVHRSTNRKKKQDESTTATELDSDVVLYTKPRQFMTHW
jgi:hypothetical protein